MKDRKLYASIFALCILPAIALGQTPATSSSDHPENSARKEVMSRVTGIGGVFIKAKDPAMLLDWYKKHLGIDVQVWGGTSFRWVDSSGDPTPGTTAWMIGNGENFAPSDAPFMVNYRVADLGAILAALREEGCNVLPRTEESEYGKFGWVMDPEGNKVELWEPPAGK
jgi:predicted enzyme related to lactoylglutathione lyase